MRAERAGPHIEVVNSIGAWQLFGVVGAAWTERMVPSLSRVVSVTLYNYYS